jgi:hypothetical protein
VDGGRAPGVDGQRLICECGSGCSAGAATMGNTAYSDFGTVDSGGAAHDDGERRSRLLRRTDRGSGGGDGVAFMGISWRKETAAANPEKSAVETRCSWP